MRDHFRRLRTLRLETWSAALVIAAGVGVGSLAAYAADNDGALSTAPSALPVAQPHTATSARSSSGTPARITGPELPPFARLAPVQLCSVNTRECRVLALYDASGRVDEGAASRIDALLGDLRDEDVHVVKLDRRTLQLVYRAAYHFRAERVDVVSAYRKPRRRHEGPHALGAAIDFKLPSVPAATLAAYLRRLPRVGVGVYTHPRTQYVHLDVRGHSYHWLDASPPRRTWRERSLRTRGLAALDASYTPALDLPEGFETPLVAGRSDQRNMP